MKEITYWDCVMAAAAQPGLVREFDRLSGSNLGEFVTRSLLSEMIDRATGRDRETIMRFLAFVYECVYTRLPDAAA